MTVRKQITLIIGSILLIAVFLYSFISAAFVNRYFSGYVESEYYETVDRIKEQAEKVIDGTIETEDEAYDVLSIFRSSLISNINVIDAEGHILVSVGSSSHMMGPMMGSGRTAISDTDYIDIIKDGENVGTLVIGRTSAIGDSEKVMQFKRLLRRGAFLSGIAALIVSVVVIIFAGEKMTKDLRATAAAAGMADSSSLDEMELSGVSEIRAIQQSLKDLSTKLKLQKRTRKENVDKLAHEVRTPLTILKTNIEGARDKVIDMDDKRLESCLAEIDYLTDILGTISDVVEYDGKEIVPDIKELDIGELVSAIRQGFKLQFEKKEISLKAEVKKHLIINSDKSLLSQALYNLLSNAYKFTPQGGSVVVSLKDNEAETLINVSDSGPGVPDEEKKKIFSAYQRGAVQKNVSGEGLGLYIAKKNIEALGGAISVTDNESGGACFTISIPK